MHDRRFPARWGNHAWLLNQTSRKLGSGLTARPATARQQRHHHHESLKASTQTIRYNFNNLSNPINCHRHRLCDQALPVDSAVHLDSLVQAILSSKSWISSCNAASHINGLPPLATMFATAMAPSAAQSAMRYQQPATCASLRSLPAGLGACSARRGVRFLRVPPPDRTSRSSQNADHILLRDLCSEANFLTYCRSHSQRPGWSGPPCQRLAWSSAQLQRELRLSQ